MYTHCIQLLILFYSILILSWLFTVNICCPKFYLRIYTNHLHVHHLHPQLAKKFPTFYGIQRFATICTRARHLSLSLACSPSPCPPILVVKRSILILSSYLCLDLPNVLFPCGFSTTTLYAPLLSSTTSLMPHPSHSWFYHLNIWWVVHITVLLIMQFQICPVLS